MARRLIESGAGPVLLFGAIEKETKPVAGLHSEGVPILVGSGLNSRRVHS